MQKTKKIQLRVKMQQKKRKKQLLTQKNKKEQKHKNTKRAKNKQYKKCNCAPAFSTLYLFHFPQSNKIKLGRGFRDFRPC